MEKRKQEALQNYRDELEAEAPDVVPVLELLDRTQLDIRRIEPARDTPPARNQAPRTWFLYCEPEQSLRERFDLAPELLVVLIPSREAQARDIDASEERLLRDYRLDRGVVLVIARDEAAESKLAQQARETRRTHVFFSFAECEEVQDPQRWLRGELLSHLGSSDLFAPGPPVYGWDFVGRQKELETIRKHLRGGRPVGLYGLRKIGKTSLLFHLRKHLIDESRGSAAPAGDTAETTIPIYLDTQNISFLELNRAGFLRELVEATYRTVSELGLSPADLDLEASLGSMKDRTKLGSDEISRASLQMFQRLLGWARQRPGQRRVVLFIDEYERLLEGRDFSRQDGLQLLVYLRGLLQSHPGMFGLLIAGRSRTLAFAPSYSGQQNPLFNLLIDFPLAALEQEELRQLMRRLGRRMSLDFEKDALDYIWEVTGGHPYLAREFGRLIDHAVPIEERKVGTKSISRETVGRLDARFRRQVAPTLQEIGETIESLAADVLFTLSYMHRYPQDVDAALAALPSDVLEQLCRFGILEERHGQWQIRIGCFGDWVEENYDSRQRSAAQG
jgi:hypothetical protein